MKCFKTILVIFAMLPFSAAYAAEPDPIIEGAKLCTRHLPRYEREYAIPTHLLSAIATTESGRYHEGLGMKLPWPWTINTGGKGYWFDSKEKAIAAVQKLRARGVQSIDVGCMQVNLYHHPEAFANLSEAFEPQTNIAYAASFLRNLYVEGGTWKKAAADYHSKTPALGREYVSQVYGSWYTIIDKLRAARLSVPESTLTAMNEMKNPSRRVASATPVPVPKQKLAEQQGRQVAAYESPHMNTISVSTVTTDRRATNIIIMRDSAATTAKVDSAPAPVLARADAPLATPAATPVPAVIPSTTPSGAPELKPADSMAIQASLQTPVQSLVADPVTGHTADASALSMLNPSAGRRSLEPVAGEKSGPNFIFND